MTQNQCGASSPDYAEIALSEMLSLLGKNEHYVESKIAEMLKAEHGLSDAEATLLANEAFEKICEAYGK